MTASRQDIGTTPYRFTYTYNDQALEANFLAARWNAGECAYPRAK